MYKVCGRYRDGEHISQLTISLSMLFQLHLKTYFPVTQGTQVNHRKQIVNSQLSFQMLYQAKHAP